MIAALILPDTTTMLECAQAARANHMHLITDGRRVVVSPVVPPGWHRMGVTHKAPPIPKETIQCAA